MKSGVSRMRVERIPSMSTSTLKGKFGTVRIRLTSQVHETQDHNRPSTVIAIRIRHQDQGML
jgi:hypothetical protein